MNPCKLQFYYIKRCRGYETHGHVILMRTGKELLASRSSRPAHSFVEKCFSSSADLWRASCQLLAKDWTLDTGKLPPGGLPETVWLSN